MAKKQDVSKKVAVINETDLTKVKSLLTSEQMNLLLAKTPKSQIRTRKAKGGGQWDYVTGAYIKKVLNLMFGFDWDFNILNYEFDLNFGQAFVHGRLTVTVNDQWGNKRNIVKEQFGRQEIKFKNEWIDGKKVKTQIPLDLGNDMKAAATDALKKCASELGIAQDIYAPNEYKEIFVTPELEDEELLEEIKTLLDEYSEYLKEDDLMNIERVIDTKETASYAKVHKLLIKIKKSKNG